jgi:hypothetical protein
MVSEAFKPKDRGLAYPQCALATPIHILIDDYRDFNSCVADMQCPERTREVLAVRFVEERKGVRMAGAQCGTWNGRRNGTVIGRSLRDWGDDGIRGTYKNGCQ